MEHGTFLKKELLIQNHEDVIPESGHHQLSEERDESGSQLQPRVRQQSPALGPWRLAELQEVAAVGMCSLVGWESSCCSHRTRSPPALPFQLAPHRALPLVWAPHFLEMGQFGGPRAWTCVLGHSGVCSNIKRQLVTKERLWDKLWE